MHLLAHIKLNRATAFLTHRVLKPSQEFRQNLVVVLKEGANVSVLQRVNRQQRSGLLVLLSLQF